MKPALDKCHGWISTGEKIGEGGFGQVYSGCRASNRNDCKYALKFVPVTAFDDEIKALERVRGLGVSPPMYDHFVCPFDEKNPLFKKVPNNPRPYGVIVSKLLPKDMELGMLFRKRIQYELYKREILRIAKVLFDNNLLLADPHLNNFMQDSDGKIYLVDVGAVVPLKQNVFGIGESWDSVKEFVLEDLDNRMLDLP
jgi:serine/threonine protein kinase